MNTELSQTQSNVDNWRTYFNKYRALLLSILIFIVLDISILLFNFYISRQIANNASVINVAAKQEVLSQKISKDLLVFERAYNKSSPYHDVLDEIEKSLVAFDKSLTIFDNGGDLVFDDGILTIDAINDEAGRQAIEAAKPMWLIYKNYTDSILYEFRNDSTVEESLITIFSREYLIKSVVGYTARNNVNLLHVMEQLTHSIESIAMQKTRQLRVIQLFGIFLAVINFFYIMFFSLKNLQRKDQALIDAKKEVEIMLNAITEGVVLIDSDLIVREHYSTEMEKIFNRTDFVGRSIVEILGEANCTEEPEVISRYIVQWFNMAQDVKDLTNDNPIAEVQVYNSVRSQFYSGKKHLKISFSRIYQQRGGVAFLLVRFKDVTDTVEQYKTIADEQADQQEQFQLMSVLLNVGEDKLIQFFHNGFEFIESMQQLVSQSDNQLQRVGEQLHQELQVFKQACCNHAFESLLSSLQRLESVTLDFLHDGTNMQSTKDQLAVGLDELAIELESLYCLASQFLSGQSQENQIAVSEA